MPMTTTWPARASFQVLSIYDNTIVNIGNMVELVDTGDMVELVDKGDMVELVDTGDMVELVDKGDMVELVDTGDLKSPEACRLVPVQVWLSPLKVVLLAC